MDTSLDVDGSKVLSVIQINGPINSGKSTVGRSLAVMLADARFIDGDDHDAAVISPGLEKWTIAMARIVCQIETASCRYLVVAYPIDYDQFEQILATCTKRAAQFIVVTLNPPLETALSDRGSRKLTFWERKRIVEMYEDGYQARSFSSLFIDTSGRAPQDCAREIASYIERVGGN